MKRIAAVALMVALAGCGTAPMTAGFTKAPKGTVSAREAADPYTGITAMQVTSLARSGNNYVDILQLNAEAPGQEIVVVFHYVPMLDDPEQPPEAAIDRITKVQVNGADLDAREREELGEALMEHASKAGERHRVVHKLGWVMAM